MNIVVVVPGRMVSFFILSFLRSAIHVNDVSFFSKIVLKENGHDQMLIIPFGQTYHHNDVNFLLRASGDNLRYISASSTVIKSKFKFSFDTFQFYCVI